MKSKASFRSHPIHPALIPFPLAFLYGAFGFHLVGVLTERSELSRTGSLLAWVGIAAALVAAVPGFIDYRHTVPPNSTGKKRATRHMLANLTAVALFAVAAFLWARPAVASATPQLLLELAGIALLTAGGWMGGVLVARNQISVDHRYANAGKWRELRLMRADEWVEVARADELLANQMKLLLTPDDRIVLGRTENGWVAFGDHCTHRGGSLADGVMICGTVQCPWHGSQFDVNTGSVRAGPANAPIRTYAVEARGDAIYLRMEKPTQSARN
jgi:nitrite reductase/ring-hydroxylating ferredoxin subunit/uncharacterized membrane protein